MHSLERTSKNTSDLSAALLGSSSIPLLTISDVYLLLSSRAKMRKKARNALVSMGKSPSQSMQLIFMYIVITQVKTEVV